MERTAYGRSRRRKFKYLNGRSRKPRPKTFKTEEAAKKYAEEKGIKKYKLVDLGADIPSRTKIKVIVE